MAREPFPATCVWHATCTSSGQDHDGEAKGASHDGALFRRIQARLLEADALLQDAVTARVDDRNVTPEGTVASEAARRSAPQMARSTPGVSAVPGRLDMEAYAEG